MIDIENAVITAVKNCLTTSHPKAQVVSGNPRKPQVFPTVNVYETNNVAYQDTMCADHVERHAVLTYSVTVYTNDMKDKKSHAKHIMRDVDECLTGLGMHRTMSRYTFGTNESTIYAITTQYKCVAGESPDCDDNKIMIYGR